LVPLAILSPAGLVNHAISSNDLFAPGTHDANSRKPFAECYHSDEASGIGKKEFKIKRFVDRP
jgi:hypothetical protein